MQFPSQLPEQGLASSSGKEVLFFRISGAWKAVESAIADVHVKTYQQSRSGKGAEMLLSVYDRLCDIPPSRYLAALRGAWREQFGGESFPDRREQLSGGTARSLRGPDRRPRSQESPSAIREIQAPEVRRFGHRDNYGYMLYYMSSEFLYQEFILFVQNRAVHFIFQSAHRELLLAHALENFYLEVNRVLEQGLYFRRQ
ncbi:MAG: hypothetical protein AAF975_02760 [Spirochaetota bacterium]